MSNLYQKLAHVYEAMYRTFIDYEEEYQYYSAILKKHNKGQLLEIGSGTGNLAGHFINNGFNYQGLDYSSAMIAIAQKKIPSGQFIQDDMRDFELERPVESIISTGRTVSYLLENKELNATFACFCSNLKLGGILCFDFIDANKFIPSIVPDKAIIHEAIDQNITYVRKSYWSLNLAYGMDVNWSSTYYTKEENGLVEIGEDEANVRTFTRDEIKIFLAINGFGNIKFVERASYFFPTFVVVAEKLT